MDFLKLLKRRSSSESGIGTSAAGAGSGLSGDGKPVKKRRTGWPLPVKEVPVCASCGREASPSQPLQSNATYVCSLCQRKRSTRHTSAAEQLTEGGRSVSYDSDEGSTESDDQQTKTPTPPGTRSQSRAQQQAANASASARPAPRASASSLKNPVWLDFVDEAVRAARSDWRRSMQCIDAAVACVAPEQQSCGVGIAHELERAKGLFWTNKDAALTILAKLLQAEMLLMLGGEGSSEGSVSTDFSRWRASGRKLQGSWQEGLELLQRMQGESDRGMKDMLRMILEAARQDMRCQQLVLVRLEAAIKAVKSTSGPKLKEGVAEALRIVDSIAPRWAHCSSCGRHRLTHRRTHIWEDFVCGSSAALLPTKTCASADDAITDWYPPHAEEAKVHVPIQPPPKPAAIQFPKTGSELDILAMVAEGVDTGKPIDTSLRQKKAKKRAAEGSTTASDKPKRKKGASGAPSRLKPPAAGPSTSAPAASKPAPPPAPPAPPAPPNLPPPVAASSGPAIVYASPHGRGPVDTPVLPPAHPSPAPTPLARPDASLKDVPQIQISKVPPQPSQRFAGGPPGIPPGMASGSRVTPAGGSISLGAQRQSYEQLPNRSHSGGLGHGLSQGAQLLQDSEAYTRQPAPGYNPGSLNPFPTAPSPAVPHSRATTPSQQPGGGSSKSPEDSSSQNLAMGVAGLPGMFMRFGLGGSDGSEPGGAHVRFSRGGVPIYTTPAFALTPAHLKDASKGSSMVRIVTSDNLPKQPPAASDADDDDSEELEPASVHKGLTITTADGFVKDSRSGLWQDPEKSPAETASEQLPNEPVSMAVDDDPAATPAKAAAAAERQAGAEKAAAADPSDEETEDTDMADAPPDARDVADDVGTARRRRPPPRRTLASITEAYVKAASRRTPSARPPARRQAPPPANTEPLAAGMQTGGVRNEAQEEANKQPSAQSGLSASAWPKLPHQIALGSSSMLPPIMLRISGQPSVAASAADPSAPAQA